MDEDDREEVLSIMDTRAFEVLMREIAYLVKDSKDKIIRYSTSEGSDRDLLILKAKSEGATKLLVDFNILLDRLKVKRGK